MSAAPGFDEELVRALTPAVLAALVGRGADFASAEDAVQEALLSAHQSWPREAPRDAKGWLVTAAWRRYLDAVRSDAARTGREQRSACEPEPGRVEQADTTLDLFFRCAHPSLSPTSAVALTLRALGGLSTRQIALAFLVPEATMAQRISRAKTTIAGTSLGAAGDVVSVARVLYLMFNEGYGGDLDLAGEAIRLARQLAGLTEEPEVAGLLALFLLHHARRDARTRADASLVPLAEQDRSRWHTDLITEGVDILQRALTADRLGPYQAQAAIAALHADAPSAQETDWVQIAEWYDELVTLTDSPVHRLNRAVAVGEADGPEAGLAALDGLAPTLPRYAAVCAHLYERAGDLERAVALYRAAAAAATRVAERDHLTLQAARLHHELTLCLGDPSDTPPTDAGIESALPGAVTSTRRRDGGTSPATRSGDDDRLLLQVAVHYGTGQGALVITAGPVGCRTAAGGGLLAGFGRPAARLRRRGRLGRPRGRGGAAGSTSRGRSAA